MALYIRKPVAVEAMQYTRATCRAVCAWLGMKHTQGSSACGTASLCVDATLEAQPNDWLVRDDQGAVHILSPEIFAATYEPATPEGR